MPSKRRKRKRKINVQPVTYIWLLLVINCIFGVYFSSLTSLRKIRVIGAPKSDEERILKLMQRAKNVPLIKLDTNAIISSLMNNAEVSSVKIDSNIFGRSIVKVELEKPVAVITDTRMYLSDKGKVFSSSTDYPDLPTISIPIEATSPNLTLLGGWYVGRMAQLCKILTAQMPNNLWNIAVNDRGIISLESSSGANVVMGSSDRLPQKIEKLKSLILERPKLLNELRQLNLTDPDAPMVTR